MAKANEVQAPTVNADADKVVTARKFTILEAATAFLTGEVWEMANPDIIAAHKTVKNFQAALKEATDKFDDSLTERRRINGADSNPGVVHFRKPRESKKNDSTLDTLAGLIG